MKTTKKTSCYVTYLLLKATAMVSMAFSKSFFSVSLLASKWNPDPKTVGMSELPHVNNMARTIETVV